VITNQYCMTMAEYNAWMNAKLYRVCATCLSCQTSGLISRSSEQRHDAAPAAEPGTPGLQAHRS
jgi:hypothetical protein